MKPILTDTDIAQLARQNQLEPAALKAVVMVESNGRGFLPDGRCKILFEGHIFWRQLVIAGINPSRLVMGNQDILYEKMNISKYVGGAGEYTRLEKAMNIHKTAALKSASYGLFQIMGFNHALCGYSTVTEFVEAMNVSEEKQLTAALNFMHNLKLIDILKQKNWKEFSRLYNGRRYAEYSYHTKLQNAYNKALTLNKL